MPSSVAAAIESDDERGPTWRHGRGVECAQGLAQRSRIVLAAADGLENTEIAERLGVSRPMVTKWRNRFAEHRLEGWLDRSRGQDAAHDHRRQVEEVIVTTLETTPKDATHWSTRSMAREVGLTQNAVLRIWQAFGLSRTARRPGSSPRTRCSSTRSATSSACT